MTRLTLATAAVVAFIANPFQQVAAVEPLTSTEFASHCIEYRNNPGDVDGIFCVRYIQGFIDGAVATDERVTDNVSREYESELTFSQRAIRTRLGSQLDRYGSSYFAEFCLGEPVPLAEVVDKVVTQLEQVDFDPQPPLARNFVYRVLRESYPCDPENTPASE